MKGTFAIAVAIALAASLAAVAAGQASASAKKAESVSLKIVPAGKKGPDGKMHDAYIGKTTIKATVGEKVTVTVKNTDGGAHSFTAPGLKVNEVFPGNKTTTFSFTVKKTGKFQWFCDIPCDSEAGHWAMSDTHRPGYMGGTVVVTA